VRDFRESRVWWKGRRLTLDIYVATAGSPRGEIYGLTTRIRRSCASIPANIAEGCGRSGDAEPARVMQIARWYSSPLEYHLLLTHDLNLLNATDYEKLSERAVEVKRMLCTFINRLRAKQPVRQTIG
jgi:four helix bundle protein